ncbi:MAG: hypothetical protein KatS3mg031_1309 [Chitinophagales bacterium]|nr:MAG: hypothetical protein KatS3mg031_1309 [Chitinophagales bacterium]
MKASHLITIQKLALLLDDFYLEQFRKYLTHIKAQKSLALIEHIRAGGFAATASDMCRLLYGKDDAHARHAFNELASATLRHTSILARNYPDYLASNVHRIALCVNEGRTEEARLLAEILLDVSKKICDYSTQVFCLTFLSQEAYLNKNTHEGLRYEEQLLEVIRHQETYFRLDKHFRQKLNPSMIDIFKKKDIREALEYLKPYFNHTSLRINLFARYAYISGVYFLQPEEFESREMYDQFLPRLISDLQNASYVVFPAFNDIQTSLTFFWINSPYLNLANKKHQVEFERWTQGFRKVNFWKYYLNRPEVLALSIKTNHYVFKYTRVAHRKLEKHAANQLYSSRDVEDMSQLIKRCELLLTDTHLHARYEKYLINLRPVYASLLILHPHKPYQDGVQFLESTLISYQQTNIKILADNIFSWLLIGYFCMKDYGACADAYARYQKIVKGRVSYPMNDIIIHFYYYLSRWVVSRKPQFVQKLRNTYNNVPKENTQQSVKQTLMEVAADFGAILSDEAIAERDIA